MTLLRDALIVVLQVEEPPDPFHPITALPVFPDLSVVVDFANDATNPVRLWTEITADVREVSYQRGGRNHELQRTEAGSLSMILDNRDGDYDPLNTSSPRYPGVQRMRWVQIRARWDGVVYPIWTGLIEAWDQKWPGFGKDATVEVTATDAFKALSLYPLDGTLFASQTTGQRVTSVLSASGVAKGTVSTGQTTLPAIVLDEETGETGLSGDALAHLLQVEETENGLLFADAAGQISFQDRHFRLLHASTRVGVIGDSGLTADTISVLYGEGDYGDSTYGGEIVYDNEIPYRDAELNFEDGDIWNDVTVTPAGGTEEHAVNTASLTKHYRRRLTRDILSASQTEALNAAEYLANRYADPAPRLPAVEVLTALIPSEWPVILGAVNSDRFLWRRRAAASTIETEVHLERVAGVITPGEGWRMTLELSPADSQTGWVLGDENLSVLGSTTRLMY